MNDWLRRFVRTDPPANHPNHWAARVNACDGWSVATDMRTLVAVRDGGASADPLRPRPNDQLSPPGLRDFVGREVSPLFVTSLPALWLWCGRVTWEECGRCGGVGETTINGDQWVCPDCDGSPRWLHAATTPAVRVAGVLADPSRLAWSLAPELEPGPVRVSKFFPPLAIVPVEAVCCDGPGWRVVVMGLDENAPWCRDLRAPQLDFHPHPDFVRLWVAHQSGVMPAGVLADWLDEHDDAAGAALMREGAADA